MPFKRGVSGNQNGRPRGVANKTTTDLRQWITSFLENNKEQLQSDWQTLEPRERILLFERYLKYTLPSLQSIPSEYYNNEALEIRIIRDVNA
jgi:hypothetical protein